MEKEFYYLKAPIARVTGYDVVIPLSAGKSYIPDVQRILRAARKTLR